MLFLIAVLTLPSTGCSRLQPKADRNSVSALLEGGSGENIAGQLEGSARINILVETRAIPEASPLSSLAEELDRVAVLRSVPLQNLRAAQAERAAAGFERYPEIIPSATAPLTGGDASIGVSVQQTIWDGGRTRAKLTDADLNISDARVETWQDRNQVIYDGLSAFVDVQRYNARIAANRKLTRELNRLNELLNERVAGGVADRGEHLRMSLSLQEVRREVVSDQTEARAAESTLARLVPQTSWPRMRGITQGTAAHCRRDWAELESPSVARARVRLMRAENNLTAVMARRFPKLVASAGSSYTAGDFSKPAVALQLDASDLLGIGRKNTIAAAQATQTGALRSYELQKDETQAELEKLEQDYSGFVSDIQQLKGLQRTSEQNLALYQEQVQAGTIPIAEGITLFQESRNTEIDLIDAYARALENCLQAARVRGVLAPFGVSYE